MEKMHDERINPSIIKKANEKTPKVNKELAAKLQAEMSLLEEKVDKRSKKKVSIFIRLIALNVKKFPLLKI